MKLVLVCTAVVLLSSAGQLARLARRRRNSIDEMFREANVTPVPRKTVVLYYEDYEVTVGMDADPGKTIGLPDIEFESDPDSYYTIISRTIDAPYPNNSFLSPYLMGMHVNVKAKEDCVTLEQSCEIATWINPSPPPGSGTHTYAVFVLKQTKMIDTNNEDLRRYQQNRARFSIEGFANTYGLIMPPAGGIFYYCQYLGEDGGQDGGNDGGEDGGEDGDKDWNEDWNEDWSED